MFFHEPTGNVGVVGRITPNHVVNRCAAPKTKQPFPSNPPSVGLSPHASYIPTVKNTLISFWSVDVDWESVQDSAISAIEVHRTDVVWIESLIDNVLDIIQNFKEAAFKVFIIEMRHFFSKFEPTLFQWNSTCMTSTN
jgi:hypothetical protein